MPLTLTKPVVCVTLLFYVLGMSRHSDQGQRVYRRVTGWRVRC